MTKLKSLGLFFTLFLSYTNLLAKNSIDTITVYYNIKWEVTTEMNSSFVSKQWADKGVFYQHDFYYPTLLPQMTGSYADKEHKKMQGTFVWYYANGVKKDSITYINNLSNGKAIGWFDNGHLSYASKFKNGILVDTSYSWYENGKKQAIIICDKKGDGLEQDFSETGQKIGGGSLMSGKRNGIWTFVDDNRTVSQTVKYEMDSAITITSFDEKGIKQKGTKPIEKIAEFLGGLSGWRRFLERNLQYPESAQEHGIQGIVTLKFIVGKEGNLYDIKVANAPDKALATEALRIMSISPNWIPATKYNRKVTYYFYQTITFQLQ